MKDLSAAELDRLLAADPASDITENELAQSRARSLSFQESDVTHIFAGGLASDHHQARSKRRRVTGGILAAVAAAAAVLTASVVHMAPSETPAATEVATGTASPTADQKDVAPFGPMQDMFVAADEVLVMEALPANNHQFLGVERVVVRQVLKGSRPLGETSVDVSSADNNMNGSLLWQQSQVEAPMTYLGFFTKSSDGGIRLLETTHALLQIQNIRTAATVDPVTEEPVDIGELQSRIHIAPRGDVPVATYTETPLNGAATDIPGTVMPDGTREGIVRGNISANEACFTFENNTEKVYLRWPAGFTAALRPLAVTGEGGVSLDDTVQAKTPIILNEWGFIYMSDRQPRPQITGYRTAETAACAGETLQVFNVQPERPGASPFQMGHGVALPPS